jgi:prophage regulatory protein
MQQRYVSDKQIAAMYGVSRVTVWRWASTDPKFPKPYKLSGGCTRWKISEVEAWEAMRPETNEAINPGEQLSAKNGMLCWTPGTDQVEIVSYPDVRNLSKKFERFSLACFTRVRRMNFEQRKLQIFIDAMHLIVRDKCDPDAVHRALINLEEYRDAMAPDMPH